MKFLEKLLHRGCAHRFGWPRVDSDGRHYQICLACGAAYEYNWETMRQTGRLLVVPTQALHQHIAVPHR
jgi:hypothetical protein